jgi:hypothetical protein
MRARHNQGEETMPAKRSDAEQRARFVMLVNKRTSIAIRSLERLGAAPGVATASDVEAVMKPIREATDRAEKSLLSARKANGTNTFLTK